MLGFDVLQQCRLVVKLPAACGTFEVLDALVHCFDVPFQVGLAPDESAADLAGYRIVFAEVNPVLVGS